MAVMYVRPLITMNSFIVMNITIAIYFYDVYVHSCTFCHFYFYFFSSKEILSMTLNVFKLIL